MILLGHEIVTVNLYATTQDYLDKSYSFENATAELFESNSRYIRLGKLKDGKTGKKIKRPNRHSWMVEYEGENYFNFGYVSDLPRWNTYVKLDIAGSNIGAFFLDRIIQQELSGTNAGSYGGGLLGVLAKESEKWGANWENEKNEKTRILIIDFAQKQHKFGNRNENCSWGFFLTRKHLIYLMDWDKKPKDIKFMKFEQVVEYLNQIK